MNNQRPWQISASTLLTRCFRHLLHRHGGAILLFSLFALLPCSLFADDARISTNDNSFTISKDKGAIEFSLYLMENDGDRSFWLDDPEIWLDGTKLCNLSDLGIPIYKTNKGIRDDSKALDNQLKELRKEEYVRKSYQYNKFITIASFDPRYSSKQDEYWVTIGITLGYNVEGEKHHVEVRGTWADNYNKKYTGRKILGFDTKAFSTNDFPASAGTATRQNGRIVWNATGLKQLADWRYAFSLQKSNSHKKQFEDQDIASWAYWDAEKNAQTYSDSFAVSNYEPCTIYPRVILWNTSNIAQWFDGRISSQHSFRKEYGAVTVKGFPRAANVSTTTTDAYAKKVKLTWEAEIHTTGQVETNGSWYILRREKDGDGAWTKVNDVAYGTRTYTDADDSKKYYDPSNGDDTQYEYAVCFVPSGWTVDKPSDAEGLYATTTYKMNRTFKVSDLKVTENPKDVTIAWTISPITDASSRNSYTLKVQRSDDGIDWKDLKEEEITSSSTTKGTYTDSEGLLQDDNRLYRVFINVQGRDYASNEVSAGISGGTSVKAFSASRGTYSKSVKLQWKVDQVGADRTYFRLQRRPLGSNDADAWTDVYTANGTSSLYSYDDETVNPGSYYEYHLRIWFYRNEQEKGVRDYYTDGFGLATGVLSGRVFYDSGTAVEGVKVNLRPSEANGESLSQFRSLRIDSVSGAGVSYVADKGMLKKLMGKDYTVQMYLSPDSAEMKGSDSYALFEAQGALSLGLRYNAATADYTLLNGTEATSLRLPANRWSHLSVVRKGDELSFYVNGNDSAQTASQPAKASSLADTDTALVLGNNAAMAAAHHFAGNVDEFRLFSKALAASTISQNYNRTLAGTEDGLAIYWPMDENIGSQTIVYDYSKSGDASNARIGLLNVPSVSSDDVPDEEQLSLCGYTDADGNFMVRGIPFSGEGTNYIATPTMGVHRFSPSSVSCYVSLNSLVFSGQNFTDVSSFPVTGRVRYASTTIPVEGATVYVDGVPASKDGELITTDQEGNYTVDVPIGDHFISVKKSGHTFTDGGRYPVDYEGTGIRQTFERAYSNVDFTDETTVIVAGRVAGGKAEEAKPLCVGAGVANIGKGIITLDFKDDPNRAEFIHAKRVETESAFYYEQDSTRRDFNTVAGTGRAYVPEGKNYIQIETDSLSGEFAVALPPLRYTTTGVTIPTQEDATFSAITVDATNPQLEYTDSLVSDDGYVTNFTYNVPVKYTYRATPTLDIRERDNGAFGIDSLEVADINGKTEKIEMFSLQGDSVKYRFGYPVYEMLVEYQYGVAAYERYVNLDGDKPVVSYDPLADIEVTIKNQYAGSTSVMASDGSVVDVQEDAFRLDSLGLATYSFMAGLPNIQKPYNRQLNASFNVDGQTIAWDKKIEAVVLGALTTGNNFTTQGPDEVMMVLRDPPGTNSKTTYSKGTEFTTKKTINNTFSTKTNVGTTILAGIGQTTMVGGIGCYVLMGAQAKANIVTGVEFDYTTTSSNTTSQTVSLTEQISTSAAPSYVGDKGDVFIGSAKNIIFGESNNVIVKKDEATGEYQLAMERGYSSGEEFTTGFNYTAWHVENKVIPDFINLRNSLLRHVGNPDSVARPKAGADPIYVTTLTPQDKGYGWSNSDSRWGNKAVGPEGFVDGYYRGPSYTMILPEDYEKKNYQDMVNFYNLQVALWQGELAANEYAKVKAIDNRDEYLDKNYSFDAGATVTATAVNKTTDDFSRTRTYSLIGTAGVESGYVYNKAIGFTAKFMETLSGTWVRTSGRTSSETSTISYTLAEDALGDNISVDVYKAPDGFGPIFYTRAGTTSNPYEDEVQTKYYRPGTVIGQKTMQAEKPEIEILDPILTGVPAGSTATFRVKLRNNSEVQRTVTYGLTVLAGKNADGAEVRMDGRLVNNGITIGLPYGETIKTFTIKQSNLDVMDYKNITLRLYSMSQPNDVGTFPGIYSDGTISVSFQPSCSNIALDASTSVINSENDNPLLLSISGYDYTMASLQGVQLQYKGANDADFRLLQEYVKDTTRLAGNLSLLPLPALSGGYKLVYSLNLRDRSFSDQTYVFRAVTVCNQNGTEVNNESDEITVARDLSRPQLIATPTPSAGILGPGDDISITFNEDIASSSLTADGNFIVTGQLNGRRVAHQTALALEAGAKAKTAATIDLNMQSFSADMWLNYSTDGRLFYHGVTDYGIAADIDDGRLKLTVGDDSATSVATLPKDKWLYLHVSYDNTGVQPVVSASYAQDDQTVRLFSQQPVHVYCGNGPLTFGGGTLTGRVQEVALWSAPRTMEEAQAEMYTVKDVNTDALIGYWPLDEGHGTMAQDKVRARNLTLSGDNSWWISDENYSVTLDGNTALKANVSAATSDDADSYLLEAWFRADKVQGAGNHAQSILSLGDSLIEVGLDSLGRLVLTASGESLTAATADLRDAAWHHVALNVLKSTKGSATLYLDGSAVRQLSASAVPPFQGDALIIGGHRTAAQAYDRFLTGAIDEVRLWKGRRTAEVIRNLMYTRVRPESDGLVAYYPMEATTIDGNNQSVTAGSPDDATGKAPVALQAVSGAGGTSAQTAFTATSAPPLTARKVQENVAFSFVASERTVKVNLEELPSRTEGCTVNVTARNIRDLHGNAMQPVTWSFYVNQSTLKWDETEVVVRKTSTNTATRSVTIRNLGGQAESWSIIGQPSWISIDRTDGILQPLAEQQLSFSVNPGLAIGTYETTLWLTGSQQIELPLRLTVRVEGGRPDWTAEEGENTMNVIGQLMVDGIVSADTADLVAAFIGDRCVGVASPEYWERYDAYIVLLNVYGHMADHQAALTYKAYDASTGRVYPFVDASIPAARKFVGDTWAGIFKNPVIFTPQDRVAQDISRDRDGSMWLSLYVKPEDNTPLGVFGDASHKIALVSNGALSAKWDNGKWIGNLVAMDNRGMYKVNVTDPFKTTVNGRTLSADSVRMRLNPMWTWIGYPLTEVNTLDAAFADAHPLEGDVVKSQNRFAMFTDGQWTGRLTALVPGEGYCYYSQSISPKTFFYPKATAQGTVRAPRLNDDGEDTFVNNCADNMTMVVVVKDGDFVVDNAVIQVFGSGSPDQGDMATLRGQSSKTVGGLHFLTIGGGAEPEMMAFVVNVDGVSHTIRQHVQYRPDAHYGSPANPCVLQIDGATGISDIGFDGNVVSTELFTLSGNLVLKTAKGGGISEQDTKRLQPGVYLKRVVYADGTSETMKITLK